MEEPPPRTSNLSIVGRVLLVAFLGAFAALALCSSLGVATLWRLRLRNRLHPEQPTMAPLVWLVHPGSAARLHRRLRAGVATASFRLPGRGKRKIPSASVDDVVSSLLREAVSLDDQVVLASRAPRVVRRRMLAVTASQVSQIEAIAGRLAVIVSASARPGGMPTGNAIRALEDRLDAVEVSRQEIVDLEAAMRATADPTHPLS